MVREEHLQSGQVTECRSGTTPVPEGGCPVSGNYDKEQ